MTRTDYETAIREAREENETNVLRFGHSYGEEVEDLFFGEDEDELPFQ